jgi:hypothetical protein
VERIPFTADTEPFCVKKTCSSLAAKLVQPDDTTENPIAVHATDTVTAPVLARISLSRCRTRRVAARRQQSEGYRGVHVSDETAKDGCVFSGKPKQERSNNQWHDRPAQFACGREPKSVRTVQQPQHNRDVETSAHRASDGAPFATIHASPCGCDILVMKLVMVVNLFELPPCQNSRLGRFWKSALSTSTALTPLAVIRTKYFENRWLSTTSHAPATT